MRRWPNVGLLLCQRRRRWLNSEPTLGQRFMFAGARVMSCYTSNVLDHVGNTNCLYFQLKNERDGFAPERGYFIHCQ